MNVIRIGNFGIAETKVGLMSFTIGNIESSYIGGDGRYFSRPDSWNEEKQKVGQFYVIPMGHNNDLPGEIQRMLDEFYAGEGSLDKIQGLIWGEGPRLYREVYPENGGIVRQWVKDDEVQAWLDSFDYVKEIHKCLVDYNHIKGFYVKIFRNKGSRLEGFKPCIAAIRHAPVNKFRLEYPSDNSDTPKRIIAGNFPYPRYDRMYDYQIFDKNDPFRYPVSMMYQHAYSFCKSFYSTPRFYGAMGWIRLANTIAPLLAKYNQNASAISYHIESPVEYWNEVEEKLKAKCAEEGKPYSEKLLEQFKDDAFAEFTSAITGKENVGKFMHTMSFPSDTRDFRGWKVIPLDKKIKDYIDAQIHIANKADEAATSGFGLHASLSNLIIDGKMASGSEMLYALKIFISSEANIPEAMLFEPFNTAIKINFPHKDIKIGFYRKIVMKEDEVTPDNRVTQNV